MNNEADSEVGASRTRLESAAREELRAAISECAAAERAANHASEVLQRAVKLERDRQITVDVTEAELRIDEKKRSKVIEDEIRAGRQPPPAPSPDANLMARHAEALMEHSAALNACGRFKAEYEAAAERREKAQGAVRNDAVAVMKAMAEELGAELREDTRRIMALSDELEALRSVQIPGTFSQNGVTLPQATTDALLAVAPVASDPRFPPEVARTRAPHAARWRRLYETLLKDAEATTSEASLESSEAA